MDIKTLEFDEFGALHVTDLSKHELLELLDIDNKERPNKLLMLVGRHLGLGDAGSAKINALPIEQQSNLVRAWMKTLGYDVPQGDLSELTTAVLANGQELAALITDNPGVRARIQKNPLGLSESSGRAVN